jgi:hypothetical protein
VFCYQNPQSEIQNQQSAIHTQILLKEDNIMTDNKPIEPGSIVCRTDKILFADIDEEVVMMDIEQGTYFGMDEIASQIWNLIEEPIRVSDLCSALHESYEVSPDECLRDVLEFLDQLNEQGLLSIRSDG